MIRTKLLTGCCSLSKGFLPILHDWRCFVLRNDLTFRLSCVHKCVNVLPQWRFPCRTLATAHLCPWMAPISECHSVWIIGDGAAEWPANGPWKSSRSMVYRTTQLSATNKRRIRLTENRRLVPAAVRAPIEAIIALPKGDTFLTNGRVLSSSVFLVSFFSLDFGTYQIRIIKCTVIWVPRCLSEFFWCHLDSDDHYKWMIHVLYYVFLHVIYIWILFVYVNIIFKYFLYLAWMFSLFR